MGSIFEGRGCAVRNHNLAASSIVTGQRVVFPKAQTGGYPSITVSKSPIDGRGVFALREFRRGERVGELWGKVISTTEATRRAKRRRRIAIVELDEAIAIDAARSKSCFKYINHSCETEHRNANWRWVGSLLRQTFCKTYGRTHVRLW